MKRRDLRVVRNEEKFNFSLGAIVESLQGAGVYTDEAITIARNIEKHYRAINQKAIELDDLIERLAEALERELDDEVASRFRQQTPPFVPLRIVRGDEQVEFSKRTLASSLQKFDLSFKEAHAVARQVEQTLRTEGREVVTERDLAHLVALTLEARFGREVRLKFEAHTHMPTELAVIEPDGLSFPYSRGILAQSLMAVGLGPELSHHLAKRAEDVLWRLGHHEVNRMTVRKVVRALVLQEAGEEFARRYELMRSVRRPERPIVIMIGGAPGVGKSTLASEIAYRLGISRIVSSDSVRQALRSLISPELSPALHASSYAAWRAELLPGEGSSARPKRKRVIRGFQRQVQQLGTALTAIANRNIEEYISCVMEGIHLVPGFMPISSFKGATVVELVVGVSDPEVHRSYFGLRDVQTHHRRNREQYLEYFDEIRVIQDFIMERARDEGVPVVEASNFEHAVEQAIEHVLSTILLEGGEDMVPTTEELKGDVQI